MNFWRLTFTLRQKTERFCRFKVNREIARKVVDKLFVLRSFNNFANMRFAKSSLESFRKAAKAKFFIRLAAISGGTIQNIRMLRNLQPQPQSLFVSFVK